MKRWIFLFALAACSHPATAPTVNEDPSLRWAALAKSCPADAPATPLAPDLRATLPPITGTLTVDDVAAANAREIPGGWGGPPFFRDGVYQMYLVDLSKKAEATAALNARGITASNDLRFLQGRWDFGELYDWYRYLRIHALRSVGWSSSDIDEAENRILYSVVNENERAKLESLLSELDIPCYLVAIRIQGYATDVDLRALYL